MKKKSILFLCLIGLASFMSCSDKSSAEFEVSLEGQLVRTDVNKGKWPKWMFGDDICSWDRDGNLYLSKLTRTEWQKAEKVLVHGHGQNEFGDMVLSQDDDGALYVIDCYMEDNMVYRNKLIALTKIQHPDNLAAIKNPDNWEKYELSKMPPFELCGDRFVILSDSTILTVGTPLDDMHNDSTPEVLNDEKLMVYTQGSGIKGNGKDRFLYWDDSGKLAFIFTINGTKTNILNHIYSDRLPIPGIAKTPSLERIHCCADNDRIFLLYKHSTIKGEIMENYDMKDPFPWGNTVEVYDWNGVKQHIIHLDKFGQEIMISKDGKTLYLYSDYMQDGSDPYIYSYDLSSLK